MPTDPYDSCPCGSGKKFKWCCQDIYADIEEAFRLNNAGQHDAALTKMAEAVKNHAGNPEVHGRQAQLLAAHGKTEEADQALNRAFAVNPDYPFGHLLRAQFRASEGEFIGALLLLRRAADLYSRDAHDQLSFVYELICELELKLNRPVAARAALKRAVLFSPDKADFQQAMDALFGAKSRFPAAACKDYTFLRPAGASANWDRALADAATGRISDVQRVFELWTTKHPDDPAAWYDLGLTRAWLGDNPAAVESLGRYVENESDEQKAAEAWTLAEVLRCGHGMEDEADVVEHRAVFVLQDPNAVIPWLQEWEQKHRLIILGSNPESGVISGLILEEVSSLVLSGASAPPAKLGSYFMLAGNVLQLWHPLKDSLEKTLGEIRDRLGPALGEPGRAVAPAHFGDIVAEALLFPTAATTQLDAETKIRSHAQSFFEETWVHRPLKSLAGTPPIDAAGHRNLRKRLRGIIDFMEQCASQTTIRLYDFNRLRQKLLESTPPPADTAQPPPSSESRDFSAMSAAQLAALEVSGLADADLDQALRASLHLDSQELAKRFAATLAERPLPAGGADRYAAFQHLISAALANRDFDAALNWVDAGEKADCEGNEGRRRNDFELKRGQVLAKKGDSAEAQAAFEKLLDRAPDELKIAGAAAEAMLSSKQSAVALQFADRGLKAARERNNRDMEGYFLELAEAARRQNT